MTSATEQFVFAPRAEFERVLKLSSSVERTRAFAALARLNTLYMIKKAGSGHIGTSFSSLELVSWIHLEGLRRASDPTQGFHDVYFSSKGHDAPALYAVLIGMGLLDFDLLHRLRRLGGLPGHPDVGTPHVHANTGSLGMGISKARGLILADRLAGRARRVFVLTGDGELQEGQFWESLQPTSNRGLHELTVVIDHNKLQSDTWVERVSALGDLERKLASFGWRVTRIDGHDVVAIGRVLGATARSGDAPHIVIADTKKGHGVSFMSSASFGSEDKFYKYHSGAPSHTDYNAAVNELVDTLRREYAALQLDAPRLERAPLPPATAPSTTGQKLVSAYGRALVAAADRDARIVALDADLVLDTGLTNFAARFPQRFFECGIAEMDMVSQAGGMARAGLLPVVHSFACFLTPRANEQIYNNSTERTKIVYVGSLAGLVPGGPGHSHQSVRDISAMGAMPNMVLVEPATEEQVGAVVDWCLNRTDSSSYIRLVSIPCEIPFTSPPGPLVFGRGAAICAGDDAVLFSYGPVMLAQAFLAAEKLRAQGVGMRVVNLPWLNAVDSEWLAAEIAPYRFVFTLDNHYLQGGQGEMLAAAIAEHNEPTRAAPSVRRFGLLEIPRCGLNDEVLRHHGLDADSLARACFAHIRSA
ncbi:MAG: transketolase C-terminal domain-containing protein [Planctomycetota bacterium]